MNNIYHDWLNIRVDKQPPSPCQLLGAAEGERDLRVLEEAAMRQMALAQNHQLTHPEESTRLQNEIAQALVSLTDPGHRLPPTHKGRQEAELGLSVLVLCLKKRGGVGARPTLWKIRVEQITLDNGQREKITHRVLSRGAAKSRARVRVLRARRNEATGQTKLIVALDRQ